MAETSDFGTFGRYREVPVGEMPAEMRDAYETTMRLRGQVPGPHKIWLANPALSKTVVPIGDYYQARSTLTKAEIEIATNLVNGRWRAAYSNYELVSTLIAPRVVPLGLYRRAEALLGDAGIVDVTMLLGWFTGVSLTLAAFDVPSNATGLEQ